MIIGREQERQTLISLTDKEESQFCVVYGRRRVGKTCLIRETFNYQFTFQHTGMARTAKKGQLLGAVWFYYRNSFQQSLTMDCLFNH